MPFKDPEKKKEYMKQYHKQRGYKQQKEYYENNTEKVLQQQKEYNKTPQGIKSTFIANWKYMGVIHDNFDELYEKYISTTKCEICKKDLSTTKKCLDHDHETGEFRWILCNSCSTYDNWKNKC